MAPKINKGCRAGDMDPVAVQSVPVSATNPWGIVTPSVRPALPQPPPAPPASPVSPPAAGQDSVSEDGDGSQVVGAVWGRLCRHCQEHPGPVVVVLTMVCIILVVTSVVNLAASKRGFSRGWNGTALVVGLCVAGVGGFVVYRAVRMEKGRG